MTQIRIQLTPNLPAKNPKATFTKKVTLDYVLLMKSIANTTKTSLKKLRVFIRKNSHHLPLGTEITNETDLSQLHNDIMLSYSKGDDYIGENNTTTPKPVKILQPDPVEKLTNTLCSMSMSKESGHPILDGCVLPYLKHIVKKYDFITMSYSPAGYYSFDYSDKMEYPPIVDWETAILRECRGLIVSSVTGEILARRFHKFFNIEDSQLQQLTEIKDDLNSMQKDESNIVKKNILVIYDKLDGSLVSPIRLDSQQVVRATRKTVVKIDVDISEYETLIRYCHQNKLTPLFEWCQSNRQIGIINHSKSSLTLIAIRHNINGYYVDLTTICKILKCDIKIPEKRTFDYLTQFDNLVDTEGVVIYHNNQLYKHKTKWYRQISLSNYHAGNQKFLSHYLKNNNKLFDLPSYKIWTYLQKYQDQNEEILQLLPNKDKPKFQKLIQYYQHKILKSKNDVDKYISNSGFKIYCDLDGVLADFHKKVYEVTGKLPDDHSKSSLWYNVHNIPDFFQLLDWTPEGSQLWTHIKDYQPTILSGVPSSDVQDWSQQKKNWCRQKLGDDVPVITCASSQKHHYIHKNKTSQNEVAILIDDRLTLKDNWESTGGIFIHHYNLTTSLYQLNKLMTDGDIYLGQIKDSSVDWLLPIKLEKMVILRGLSGSGKSVLASYLKENQTDMETIIASADDYFKKDNVYKFDVSQLDQAHTYCYKLTDKMLKKQNIRVIIDNTNSQKKEYQKYIELAQKYQIPYQILEIEIKDQKIMPLLTQRNVHHDNPYVNINMFKRWESDPSAMMLKPYLTN